MGKKNNKINYTENDGSRSRAATLWNVQNIATFCDLCIKEMEAGYCIDTHLNKLGWENLVINFSKETGKKYDKAQLKNKWGSLKAEWKMWKELIGKETSLGWDPAKNTIDASEEWWSGKIQVCSDNAKFQNKGINPDMEVKLDKMFMHTRTTSEHFQASPSECRDVSKDDVIKLKGSDDPDHFIPVVTTQAAKRSSGRGKKRTVQQPETQVRKERKGKGVAVGGGKVRGALKLSEKNQKIEHLVESVDSSSSVTNKEEEGLHGSSITEVMKVVESLPGVEPGSKLWWFATQLFISEDSREMFTYMKDHSSKLQWLNMMFSRK